MRKLRSREHYTYTGRQALKDAMGERAGDSRRAKAQEENAVPGSNGLASNQPSLQDPEARL